MSIYFRQTTLIYMNMIVRTCKIPFAFAFFVFLFTSCEKREADPVEINNPTLQFTSEITGDATRATNTSWDTGDRIGIFMKSTGTTLAAPNIVDGVSNREYVTPAGNLFTPASESQAIRFPQNGAGVDFIAYYPYTGNLSGLTRNVDVSDQSNPAEIDLLYSDNIVNANPNDPHSTLRFSRRLTKIIFNIYASNNVTSLSGLRVTLSGAPTLATFDLADATLTTNTASVADILLHTTVDANTAQAEAILIPNEGGAGRKVTFGLEGVGTFEWEIPATEKWERGKKYTCSITLNAEGVDVTQRGCVETPVMSHPLPANMLYIAHAMPGDQNVRNYAMLYDKDNRLAHWVAYPLHAYYLGSSGRNPDWKYDPAIGESFQPLLRNGFGINGIDRGHQIPSADRTKDVPTNKTTFYFSNMTAQNSTLNQGQWGTLEGKVREWTAQCDTMYVVTGAAITTPADPTITYVQDNSGQSVAKPKYYYKALAQLVNGNYYTIAFKIDNVAPAGNYNSYRLTVKELEEATSLTFFPSIPLNNKNEIISQRWN